MTTRKRITLCLCCSAGGPLDTINEWFALIFESYLLFSLNQLNLGVINKKVIVKLTKAELHFEVASSLKVFSLLKLDLDLEYRFCSCHRITS